MEEPIERHGSSSMTPQFNNASGFSWVMSKLSLGSFCCNPLF